MTRKPQRTWPGDGVYDGLTVNPIDRELARLWAQSQGFGAVWRIEVKDGLAKVYQFDDPPRDGQGNPRLLDPVTVPIEETS